MDVRITLAAMTLGGLVALTGCSDSNNSTTPAAQAPQFDSVDKISRELGCTPEDMGISKGMKQGKTCTSGKGEDMKMYGIFEFENATARDILMGQNGDRYLALSDTWAITGEGDDLIGARDKMGGSLLGDATPSGEPSASDEPSGEPGEEPPADLDCETADQETWMKWCEHEMAGPAEVPLGKTAVHNGEQVRVDKVYCNNNARRVLEEVEENPKYGDPKADPDYELPAMIDARAAKNEEFCLVAVEWKNVSKKPMYASEFGTLVTSNGVEYDENDYGGTLTNQSNPDPDFYAGEFNPGKGYRIILSYTVPKGTKVVSVNWGADPRGENAAYALKLTK